MKKKFTRGISALLATTFVFSNCIVSSGIDVRRFVSYDEDELVSVFVKVEGEPTLAGEDARKKGTDYLKTKKAQKYVEKLEGVQEDAQCYIESFFPELETINNYTDLVNGFVCKVPQEFFDDIESCPVVKSVQKTQTYTIPEMIHALPVGTVDTYRESTGLLGEGEVVAILDTEIDITHEMFAPIDDCDVKLTKEIVLDVISKNVLNADCSTNKAYISSKLPFVYSYTNYDDPFSLADEEGFHGTHVSGICAGNQSTYEGQAISGIAPNAQIVFMDVFDRDPESGGNVTDDYTIAAAMEDAANLGVDVISMSLGCDSEFNDIYLDAVANAENAGIIVCAAAGNEGKCTESNIPEHPDTSTICNPGSVDGIMSVASCNNSICMCGDMTITGDDTPIVFSDITVDVSLADIFAGETIEYVYCGKGTPEDFEGLDLSGKLALCDYDPFVLRDLEQYALDTNLDGVIFCDTVDQSLQTRFRNQLILGAFVTKADGERLKNAETKEITFSTDRTHMISYPAGISDFSSYGVSQNLKIKPDITGVGDLVLSADYNNTYSYASGTSMATPYFAGCLLLADEYLSIHRPDLLGKEKISYIKNSLMNSARALIEPETNLYTSPRMQGSGVVSLSNFLNVNVIMTGDEGEAKVNLYDNLTDNFVIPITITNSSNEDVTFDKATLALTTDDSYYEENFEKTLIYSAQSLNSQCDLSELTTVPANSSKTVNLNVSLDPAQTSELKSIFTNGFFVEGFVLLEESDNCCDISIPVLGFYGDWADVPIFDKFFYEDGSATGLSSPSSYIGAYIFPLGNFSGEEQKFYLSPNNDGFLDSPYFSIYPLRESINTGVKIYDENGELIDTYEYNIITSRFSENIIGGCDIDNLEEGKTYTAQLFGHINYKGAEDHIQTMEYDFTIDTTAPTIIEEKITINDEGREILELTVSDESKLRGIAVFGEGTGGVEGQYDPEHPEYSGLTPEDGKDYFNISDLGGFYTYSSLTNNSVLTAKGIDQFASLPYETSYSFADMISSNITDNTCTIRYDITDMESYNFITVDGAFNMTQYTNGSPVVENISIKDAVVGEKLPLVEPKVYSKAPLTKSCWQISTDGEDWNDFDPETIMTKEHHGSYIRYYAENSSGFGFSNVVSIKLLTQSTDPTEPTQSTTDTTSSNPKSEQSTLTTQNPATGSKPILISCAILLGGIITIKKRRD